MLNMDKSQFTTMPYSKGKSAVIIIVLILLDYFLCVPLLIASYIFMKKGHAALAIALCIANACVDCLPFVDEVLQIILVAVPIYKAFQNEEGFVPTMRDIFDSGKEQLPEFVIEGTVLKQYNGKSEEVIIPDGITEIYGGSFSGAFSGNRHLRSVKMPEGLKLIGTNAFESCTNLTSVEIPYGVEKIDTGAFDSCTNLTYLEIPDSVVRIESAFSFCENLEQVVLPQNVKLALGAFPKTTTLIRCDAHITGEQRMKCHMIIHKTAKTAATIGAGTSAIPGIGAVAKSVPLSVLEIKMVIDLAKAFDKELDESLAQAILSAALGTVGGKLVAGKVADIATSFVPGANVVVGGATAAATVETIGWTVVNLLSKDEF